MTVTAAGALSVTALETATIRADRRRRRRGQRRQPVRRERLATASPSRSRPTSSSAAPWRPSPSTLRTNGGDVAVTATNTSTIEALLPTEASSPELSIGVTLAFNSIGWDRTTSSSTLAAISGSDILSTELPARTIASVSATTIDAAGGVRSRPSPAPRSTPRSSRPRRPSRLRRSTTPRTRDRRGHRAQPPHRRRSRRRSPAPRRCLRGRAICSSPPTRPPR